MEYDVKRHGVFMKWHSVENALPDKDQNVLVYRVGHIVTTMSRAKFAAHEAERWINYLYTPKDEVMYL